VSRTTGSSVDGDGSALTEEMRTTDREEERFRALFQYASDLISVVAAEGILSYANPSHPLLICQSLESRVHSKPPKSRAGLVLLYRRLRESPIYREVSANGQGAHTQSSRDSGREP
jgi:PAS domain-containing protein